MEFRILGPLEVVADGASLDLGGPKQRLLLALLLVRADEIVSNDRLIDDLWGEPPRTALSALQVHVANLRRLLADGATVLQTRPPGYVIHPGSGLDLRKFERRLDEAEQAWGTGDAETAARTLRSAIDLWRGPPLADLTYEPALQAAIQRLDELRLIALERRFDAELALGRHAALIAELEPLAAENPFRERLQGQLMRALYRSGRQADALAAYRTARAGLADELGIEPGPELRALERAILAHDPELELDSAAAEAPAPAAQARSLLAVLPDVGAEEMLGLGRVLAASTRSELVLVLPLPAADELGVEAARLNELRAALLDHGVRVRTAAFASADAPADVARLATRLDVALVLAADLELLTATLPCDAAVLFARPGEDSGAVIVPFGGGEHDWAAVELGAWIARAAEAPLRLAGTAADPGLGRRDASLALADASLAVQYALGIAAEPVLVERGTDALLEATNEARVLVVGLSERWREEGVGDFRLEIARRARPPVLLVRRGLRPGALAPRESMTRFTWSVGPGIHASVSA